MAMNQKEKEVLLSNIKDNLSSIVGASGNPEELVRLTTAIVQGTKRLLEGVPEGMTNTSTSALTAFVLCAKSVAKNPRGVDAKVIQQLSSTRGEVEKNVIVLEKWHFRTRSPIPEDLSEVLGDISKQQDNRQSPESQADPDREKNLTWDLQRKRDTLLLKMDPQQAPDPFDDPQNVMVTAVQGLMKGADELTKYGDGKMPSKDVLLEPMILVVEMVCKLLDLVDGLFVSKYPMRSQVYSFCTALIDNVLAYGNRTKSDDILSLRNISTQIPALLNASKVMVEQCETRLSSVKSNMEMSMMRTSELKGMDDTVKDGINPVARKRNKPPPAPSAKPKKEVKPKPDVEVCCMVCTNVAVDQKTQQPISRGTELILMVHASATIKDIKQDLASRTGILYDSIQLNHQGQEELGDSCTINPNNPSPYFFFNRDEPTEDELREKRKDDRKKNKTTIENLDWSQVKGPIAVAVFEYDTLGDEKSLAFDEGDIIEILEKSADGWWEGRSGDNSGTFPASFVKEITSKEEGMRLFDSSKNGSNSSSLLEPESNERGTSSPLEGHSSDISITTSHSPKPFSKKKKNFSRGMSNPEFSTSDFAKVREMKEKGLSLFQKKKKSSGYANLTVYNEEIPERQESPVEPPSGKHSPKPPKPLFKPRKSFGSSSGISRPPRVLGDDLVVEKAPQHRTVSPNAPPPPQEQSSPGLKPKQVGGAGKRPPPPRPQPFAKTHPTQAAKLDALIKSQDSIEEEEVSLSAKAKASNSMEDLLKNLQDFEEAESVDPTMIVSTSSHSGSVEYETYDRPITPPHHNEVETIKISEYKSDSETEHTDEELDGIDDEEVDNEVETEKKMAIPLSSLTVQQDWNPHEWTPSPDPPKHSARKLPSWSIDVNVTQDKDATPRRHTADSLVNPQKTKPTPPPKVMSRPRRSISGSPKVTPSGSPKATPTPSPRETPSGSPKLSSKSDHPPPSVTSHSPVAPPRLKKKINNGSVDGPSRRGPTRAPPPPPPYKVSGIPNSRSDADMLGSKAVQGLQRRLTVSKQREQLRSKPMVRSRSPIVQRKTRAIVKTDTHLTRNLLFHDCTGIGKSGILYKEGSQSPDWKARHFNVVEDGILYYDSPHNWSGKDCPPLGEIPVKQIIKAMSVDPRGTYHCFVILMRYETSILLGAEAMEDAVDWVKSINKVVKLVRHKDKPLSYLASTSATEYCLYYLLHASVPLSKKVFKLSHDFGQMNDWLDQINKGEEASLSHLSNPSSAVCLLKALLTPDKLGYVISSEIAKDVSVKVKRNASMADIKAKLHHLHDDMLHILHLFLSVFSKALSSNDTKPTDKIEVSDLNRMFGGGLFEGLKPNQSLTLLNFMITQHDTMF